MTRNRGAPDHAGQAIERGVERLKDFIRGRNEGDTQAGRGPAVRGLQSLPGLDAGRVVDAPLQPSRQAPARIIIDGSNIKIRWPPFTISTHYFRNTYFYVRVHT